MRVDDRSLSRKRRRVLYCSGMFEGINYKRHAFWLLQLCGWGAFGVSMFLATTAAGIPARDAALNKAAFTFLGLLFTVPLRAAYRSLYRKNISGLKIIPIAVVLSYFSAMLWTATFQMTIDVLSVWIRDGLFNPGGWERLFNGGLYHTFVLLAW